MSHPDHKSQAVGSAHRGSSSTWRQGSGGVAAHRPSSSTWRQGSAEVAAHRPSSLTWRQGSAEVAAHRGSSLTWRPGSGGVAAHRGSSLTRQERTSSHPGLGRDESRPHVDPAGASDVTLARARRTEGGRPSPRGRPVRPKGGRSAERDPGGGRPPPGPQAREVLRARRWSRPDARPGDPLVDADVGGGLAGRRAKAGRPRRSPPRPARAPPRAGHPVTRPARETGFGARTRRSNPPKGRTGR